MKLTTVVLRTVAAAIAIVVLCGSNASADVWLPFDNFAGFSRDAFLFTNEKGQMDVSYQSNRTSVSGGVARQQAGRTKADDAYGAWSKSANIIPTNSTVSGRAKFGNNASKQYVWGGFWGLYDQAKKKKQNWHFLEHDILETFPGGSFFNRYIAKNWKTNQVFVGNGLRAINGVQWWRNNWRVYKCTIFNNRGVFNSGGVSRTVQTAVRSFTSRLMITHRPWGSSIFSVPVNSRIADMQIDYVFINTP